MGGWWSNVIFMSNTTFELSWGWVGVVTIYIWHLPTQVHYDDTKMCDRHKFYKTSSRLQNKRNQNLPAKTRNLPGFVLGHFQASRFRLWYLVWKFSTSWLARNFCAKSPVYKGTSWFNQELRRDVVHRFLNYWSLVLVSLFSALTPSPYLDLQNV